ncbi:hypothetical protein ACTMTJ_03095 [Phytohabitans sp. LJ34]|uniref:hypothetical protein n=1 Tax=Phytohabitans sp. LJ34 TaxID=3452217 RepID=UPI003F8A40E8
MTDDTVSRLLEEAVPGIPDELRRPPLREVRARARRRRTRRNALAAAAVTMALVITPALWRQATPDESAPPSAGERPVLPGSTLGTKVTWWMARVDRTGTKVTLYATRPPDGPPCQDRWFLQASTAMEDDVATLGLWDVSVDGLGCPSQGGGSLVPVEVTLHQPLGDRALVDGFDETTRPVYREADLPVVPQGPDGWSEVTTSFGASPGSEGLWSVGYTRSGGPDVWIHGYPPDQAPTPAADPIDTVDVLGARGTIYPRAIKEIGYELRWEASGVVYFLELSPTEGERISLQQFRQVLTRLDIS